MVANGKMKGIACILEMANRRAKRSEIWDTTVLVEHIHVWDNLEIVMFKVILGHWCTCDFSKNMILKFF